ncbi:ABC transporter ATP-binding protein [Pararhizobium sp. IMCC21322]|uniref:ABC transporter ATP-binding protein n=1 Tax=Pararhizobium sp. IMCC21322 TaxID=3067903 RepID=UPI0027404ECE|nr:ABC transporter ATP-binding protein [Pararhizobium sp. IMCC21322]
MVTTTPLLSIRDLHVNFQTHDGLVEAVKGVDCDILPGECLGIVGESGSGKSQTFLAVMGLLHRNGTARGTVDFQGADLLAMDGKALNQIRGRAISMVFQDPLTSLTPHLKIGVQMREVLKTHQQMSGAEADAKCLEWLQRVHIPLASQRLRQYPHELSGGMRQRVMIAMAMLCDPKLLIADEPTTALDVTIQAEILDLMDELRRDHGTAIALITHDMGVVARMCDRIQVMRYGRYVEEGAADDIFYAPQNGYTKMLLEAMPRLDGKSGSDRQIKPYQPRLEQEDFLNVDDLKVHFQISNGFFAKPAILRAVDGVSFALRPGETIGIVGESGSGKSTLARAVLQLIPPTFGAVTWLGANLTALDRHAMTQKRKDLQIVFQDPMASLNPAMTIGDSIMEPMRIFRRDATKADRKALIAAQMERVGLEPAMINRYPHELSGGQNQRVGIARATILRPKLVICDEAVSALDVSIQAQILELLGGLQAESDLSYLFISHDLSVVREISHRILVMYLGSVVEMADRDDLFKNPQHPYTRQLISAVPIPDPKIEKSRKRLRLKGELTSPIDPMARLRFLPSRMGNDTPYQPKLLERSPGHFVAEHDPLEDLLLE